MDNIKIKTSLFTQRLHVKQYSTTSEYYLSMLQQDISSTSALSNTVIEE